ncbi:chorismate synthase, partial [Saccharothrix sp. ST-888]|uniref:chorismate synthase n=1 Tax=Saccharothrix sp. ST-888 TaxID=1427391 RepID=UPI0005EC43D3
VQEGASSGPALVGTLEGLPAGVPVTTAMVADALARQRLGYGRGARMKFGQDEVTFLVGCLLYTSGAPAGYRD